MGGGEPNTVVRRPDQRQKKAQVLGHNLLVSSPLFRLAALDPARPVCNRAHLGMQRI